MNKIRPRPFVRTVWEIRKTLILHTLVEIIPSILVKTRKDFLDKLSAVESLAERAHLDIVDGIFVPNVTIDGVEEVKSVDTPLKIGVHLMVSKPENHVGRWLSLPVDDIIFHIESTKKAGEIIQQIKEGEKLAGLAVNPETPIELIRPFVDEVDLVHFLTVEPGFYGGEFVEAVLDKISDFHYFYPDKIISVDGGVTPETAPKIVQAGADILIVGTYIFESPSVVEAIENLRQAINLG